MQDMDDTDRIVSALYAVARCRFGGFVKPADFLKHQYEFMGTLNEERGRDTPNEAAP
jgi:hypothetical protein